MSSILSYIIAYTQFNLISRNVFLCPLSPKTLFETRKDSADLEKLLNNPMRGFFKSEARNKISNRFWPFGCLETSAVGLRLGESLLPLVGISGALKNLATVPFIFSSNFFPFGFRAPCKTSDLTLCRYVWRKVTSFHPSLFFIPCFKSCYVIKARDWPPYQKQRGVITNVLYIKRNRSP